MARLRLPGRLDPVAVHPDIAIYAVPNNGGWYDFGYFLGVVVFGVGANRGRKMEYRERVDPREAHRGHRPRMTRSLR